MTRSRIKSIQALQRRGSCRQHVGSIKAQMTWILVATSWYLFRVCNATQHLIFLRHTNCPSALTETFPTSEDARSNARSNSIFDFPSDSPPEETTALSARCLSFRAASFMPSSPRCKSLRYSVRCFERSSTYSYVKPCTYQVCTWYVQYVRYRI